jgi:hypothetical protein
VPERTEKRVHPCECNGGWPTTHTLYRSKNGVAKMWERTFVCTNCGTHKPPPERVDLAAADVETATSAAA